MKIDSDIKDKIINYLADSCNTEMQAEEIFGVYVDDVITIILEAGYERCAACGYWQHKRHLKEDGNDYICNDCIE